MKSPYAYIAIEGNIGAGKTTFATWLAEHLGGDLLLEQFQENPFLEKFYADPERFALSVELAFVSDRYRQLRERLGARLRPSRSTPTSTLTMDPWEDPWEDPMPAPERDPRYPRPRGIPRRR